MKTISATDANRKFSKLLKEVSEGEIVTVLSRGRPVAILSPFKGENDTSRQAAKKRLLKRLGRQRITGKRQWIRDELYK